MIFWQGPRIQSLVLILVVILSLYVCMPPWRPHRIWSSYPVTCMHAAVKSSPHLKKLSCHFMYACQRRDLAASEVVILSHVCMLPWRPHRIWSSYPVTLCWAVSYTPQDTLIIASSIAFHSKRYIKFKIRIPYLWLYLYYLKDINFISKYELRINSLRFYYFTLHETKWKV